MTSRSILTKKVKKPQADDAPAALKRWAINKATSGDQNYLQGLLKANKLRQLNEMPTRIKKEVGKLIALQNKIPRPLFATVMTEGNGHDSYLFPRGRYKGIDRSIQKPVIRSYIQAVSPTRRRPANNGSGRGELAEDLVNPNNPLTARVITNRLWHHLFGRGIVATVDNFGVLGAKPSHPELLDHLAMNLIKEKWSLKKMIKKMVLSSTFRSSTTPSKIAKDTDPLKIYLQSMPVRRLEAEAIRDTLLSVSGRLSHKQFGNPVSIHLTAFMNGRGRPRKSGPLDGANRRSIYIAVRRNFLSPFMLSFDTPLPVTTFGKRNTTNVPAQALTLMNDPFVLDQAKHFATDLIKEHPTVKKRIQALYQRAYNRQPSRDEAKEFSEFLNSKKSELKLTTKQAKDSHAIWTDICHIIFNTKEFIYLF